MRIVTVVAALAVTLMASEVFAVQSRCLVGKSKCVAKKVGSLLKCEQHAETPWKDTDPNAGDCVHKAQEKFDGGSDPAKGCFEKLENRVPNDCLTFDDTAATEAVVDACLAHLVDAIDPPPLEQTRCGVGKKKCVAKTLSGLLKCFQKAQTPGGPTDPNSAGCVDKATSKFDGGSDPSMGCVAKLESKIGNDCLPPVGNTGGLSRLVDSCTTALLTRLEATLPAGCEAVVGGFCWVLGAPGASCDAACAGIGKVCSTATASYAGGGGTDAKCENVLIALGAPGTFGYDDPCSDYPGQFGCFRDSSTGAQGRCKSSTTCSDTLAGFERVCACE